MRLILLTREKRDDAELRPGPGRAGRHTEVNERSDTKCLAHAIRLALILILGSCRSGAAAPDEIDIHATEYAFRAPATLVPGAVAFRLVNDGKFWHEVQLFRFRPGVTADSATRLLAADSIPDEARDSTGSVLIAGAGLAGQQRILVTTSRGD